MGSSFRLLTAASLALAVFIFLVPVLVHNGAGESTDLKMIQKMILTRPVSQEVQRSLDDLKLLGVHVKREAEWRVGVCGGTKGSGAWLREWIEFHLLSGVDHIWIGNDNDETTEDGTRAILEFYEALGFVTVLPGRMPKNVSGCENQLPQNQADCSAPKWCAMQVGQKVDWLIFMDTDEFAFPQYGCSISSYVTKTCSPYQAAVNLRWERFGTNGFVQQPLGLMTASFLESGGDCSTIDYEPYSTHDYCWKKRWTYCFECRHIKQMYNTGACATVGHIGWVHWLVNTSAWIPWNQGKGGGRFLQSHATGLPFAHKNCFTAREVEETPECESWDKVGGGSNLVPKYSGSCCGAGVAYHHYGTKALQYFVQKRKTSVRKDPRGYRPPLNIINLHGTLNPSALKFTRALKQRFKTLGIPTEYGTQFIDLPNGRTCFAETGRLYVSRTKHGTAAIVVAAEDTTQCCTACIEYNPPCKAWSFLDNCVLLIPSAIRMRGNMSLTTYRHPRSLVPAWRNFSVHATSGFPLTEECHVHH